MKTLFKNQFEKHGKTKFLIGYSFIFAVILTTAVWILTPFLTGIKLSSKMIPVYMSVYMLVGFMSALVEINRINKSK